MWLLGLEESPRCEWVAVALTGDKSSKRLIRRLIPWKFTTLAGSTSSRYFSFWNFLARISFVICENFSLPPWGPSSRKSGSRLHFSSLVKDLTRLCPKTLWDSSEASTFKATYKCFIQKYNNVIHWISVLPCIPLNFSHPKEFCLEDRLFSIGDIYLY